MKEALKKIASVCKQIFGYGIMIALFMGTFVFTGYVIALIVGGDTAALICDFIKNKIAPVMFYTASIMVLFGIITMYLSGETALTVGKKKKKAEDEKK